MFHALGEEFAKRFLPAQRARAERLADHGVMRNAANRLANSRELTQGRPCPPELTAVAQAIVQLQSARNEADYDALARFTQAEVLDHVVRASGAIEHLRSTGVTTPDDLEAFLMELVLLPWRTR